MSLMSLDGRSSLHAIHAEASGVKGWIEAELEPDTGDARVGAGQLEIALNQLSSGNSLYDAELHRRLDIRRYPAVTGVLSDWQPTVTRGSYRVNGAVTFRGVTRDVEDNMSLSVEDDRTVVLDGAHLFDIRDYGMDPPRILALRVYPEVTIRVALVGRRVD